ncbi:MAG: prenyltransferase/squalene oxidase repeat-containing protein [Acidimicrobiales bacterium]
MFTPHRSVGRLAALVAGLAAATSLGVASLVVVPASASTATSSATAAAVPPAATAALDWLEGELAKDSGHLTTASEYQGAVSSYDDWGLTIDAALALAAAGRGSGAPAMTARAQLAEHIADYVTGAAFGAPDDRYAAALAKATLAAEILGADPASFGGLDLPAELRDRLQSTGVDAGRFTDRSSYGDYSNGLGQALAIMGLARTTGGVPAPALAFLLDQQCPGGGFRGDYTTSGGCADAARGTVDATGFAIQALTSVEPTCAVRAAIAGAASWLVTSQGSNGSFGGESGANTNSTGLAAQALRAIGSTTAADRAADFITGLQLATGDDAGAIALNQAGYASAADGIAILERDGFRRATGQAVLALDLPAYSEIGANAVDPARLTPCTEPAPGTSTATGAASSSTATLGGTLTVTGSGFAPGERVSVTLLSTPVLLATATADSQGHVTQLVTIPADLEVGDYQIELVGLSSGARVSIPVEVLGTSVRRSATLPATGRPTGQETELAVGLLVLGAALVGVARRRVAHD